jgi:hypothetical protein
MGKKISEQDQAQLAVRVTPALKREVEAILRGYSDRDLQITASDVLLAALNSWLDADDERRFEVLEKRLGRDARLAFSRWQARQAAPASAEDVAQAERIRQQVRQAEPQAGRQQGRKQRGRSAG